MRKLLLILIYFSVTQMAHADDLYYYSRYPTVKYLDSKAELCDLYVRDNSESFKSDMHELMLSHQNKDWIKTRKTLKRYGQDNEMTEIFKHSFIKSLIDCGNNYTFSNGINYYRKLFTDGTYYILQINHMANNQYPYEGDIQNDYNHIISTLNTILSSKNKTANKSLNQIGAKDAPPG